jgi:hypothetical protein
MRFHHIIVVSFLVTAALELYAVLTHNYTISEFLLSNVQMRYRVAIVFAICSFLIYHFLIEYPTYK